MRNGAGRAVRVRVFVDYWNFAGNWCGITGMQPDKNLDWAVFPQAILDALDGIPQLRNRRKEFRAIKVYSSIRPPGVAEFTRVSEEVQFEEEKRLQRWFQDHLDQLTAYTVDITPKADEPLACEVCNRQNSHLVEQGVDTKIAIDLVSLASNDLFDIAVLITEDGDLVPSMQCVQDSLDKQVVHIGFRDKKSAVRTEAWGHLFVDDILADILIN